MAENIQDGSVVWAPRSMQAKALIDLIYPVGIVVAVAKDTRPGFLSYGTWREVDPGRFLQSVASGAGAKVEAGLPNITGGIYNDYYNDAGSNTGGEWAGLRAEGALQTEASTTNQGIAGSPWTGGKIMKSITVDASRSNAIYGKSTTVQPPAYTVHYYERTA